MLDRRVENRRRRFELSNIIDHILPNGGVEEIAGTLRSSVDCGSYARNQGRQVARQGDVILQSLDRCAHCAAAVVTEHHDERRAEHGDGVLHTRNRVVIGEVTRDPANE